MAATLPTPGAADVLYIVDLPGYVFRAYHAVAPLTSPSGEPTHATYGTVNMLSKLVTDRKPALLAVAMDSPGRTFRDDLDPRYKATRPPAPADLSVQMARCRELVDAYRIPVFMGEGLEADDFIATAVKEARRQGLRVVIASSDKDLMQLIEEGHVWMWDAMRDRVFGPAEVREKFGVGPEQVRDLLALVGDSSDNVPGVRSVGPKTAAELLTAHKTLEGVYEHLEEVKRDKLREALREHKAEAFLSQQLVTLREDAPLTFDLKELRYGGADIAKLRELFTTLGFTRHLNALERLSAAVAPSGTDVAVSGSPGRAGKPERGSVEMSGENSARISAASTNTALRMSQPARVVLTAADLDSLVSEVGSTGIAIAAVGTSGDAAWAEWVGLALGTSDQAYYVPFAHRYLGAPEQLSLEATLLRCKSLLEDPHVAKLGHDLKFTEVMLGRAGVQLAGQQFDAMLAQYLLDPEAETDLASVGETHHIGGVPTLADLTKRERGQPERNAGDLEIAQVVPVATNLVQAPIAMRSEMTADLKKHGLDKLLSDLELPLSHVLSIMEQHGVAVDVGQLETMGQEMALELKRIEREAQAYASEELNLASPKQLEHVLFDVLGLKSARKTKTGRSTDAEVLEKLADEHPLPALVLEHRAIAKLKGTYVDALPRLIHPKTGRIHTRWSQAVAATGRLSSHDPNLQNIPIRTPLGKLIRRAFVAAPGNVLVSADYSQIELRVLAHLSKDEKLLEAFTTGQDVHVRTASEIFGVPVDQVTDEMRRQSKTINFGVIYGMGEMALSRRLGIQRARAKEFIEAYFIQYARVRTFMETTLTIARETGEVRTLYGRRRLVPDLKAGSPMMRAQAERIAQNTPIQGTAADILKMAMIACAGIKGATMILTVHDELVFEVPENQVKRVMGEVREAMMSAAHLDVPLEVTAGSGANWADAH